MMCLFAVSSKPAQLQPLRFFWSGLGWVRFQAPYPISRKRKRRIWGFSEQQDRTPQPLTIWSGSPTGQGQDTSTPSQLEVAPLILAATITGCEARVVCSNLCFSSSGRHGPRGPTTRHQSISAVFCYEMWSFMCRTAKGSRKQESLVVGAELHADASAR